MSTSQPPEQQIPEQQIPEPGWPQWADTPAKRERNQQSQARRNERIWAANQDNACAANGVTADGRPYHYSAAHNGYVFDDEQDEGQQS